MSQAHDPQTLAFYDREAQAYGARDDQASPHLAAFLDRLDPGARILELGCGAGRDAADMLARGFEVDATDGCEGLIRQAQGRLGRPVRRMLFGELDAQEAYDAVWANASLLHVPDTALPDVLRRVHRALKTGGRFHASFKAGEGGGRDSLGRYYNFPTRERLLLTYGEAGVWTDLRLTVGEGGGYDGVRRTWLLVEATR